MVNPEPPLAKLTFQLRPARPSDSGALAAIELESFPDPSWTAQDFLRHDCTVIEIGDAFLERVEMEATIGGFLVSRETFAGTTNAPPEREILNLAVAAGFRRLGIATRLLAHELERHANIFLEVRESNVAAIQLYKNAGFSEISRRRDYYGNPIESAIVMRMK